MIIPRGEQDWGPTHLAEEKMNDSKYASAAIEQLQKHHDRPFFIACGLFHPHMPWYVPQKYFELYPLDEIELPKTIPDDLEDILNKSGKPAKPHVTWTRVEKAGPSMTM